MFLYLGTDLCELALLILLLLVDFDASPTTLPYPTQKHQNRTQKTPLPIHQKPPCPHFPSDHSMVSRPVTGPGSQHRGQGHDEERCGGHGDLRGHQLRDVAWHVGRREAQAPGARRDGARLGQLGPTELEGRLVGRHGRLEVRFGGPRAL